nr:element excision factor XisH family protein [Phaeodactylibacter xiamenensis]
MHFDLLFFPLAALKSLAVRTDACVFRLASEKNTCVNFAQILPWRTIAAEKGTEKIAVEIKSFLGTSRVYDFHQAIGQFVIYKMALKRNQELRTLF